MPISLPSYLNSSRAPHCNSYSKCFLFQVCVNMALHLFTDLSMKADQPIACPVGLSGISVTGMYSSTLSLKGVSKKAIIPNKFAS